jgi:hypothetical protein
VGGTKTDAADRAVDVLPLLRDELAAHAAAHPERDRDALVFATGTGGKQSLTNGMEVGVEAEPPQPLPPLDARTWAFRGLADRLRQR